MIRPKTILTTAAFIALTTNLAWPNPPTPQHPPTSAERLVEWTLISHKPYADPFNNVDVDVIFERNGQSWRIPTFWHGANQWTVRFAPPAPGEYRYHLESTDRSNPDLNGHAGRVTIRAYTSPGPRKSR